jgi:hypothetical protein
MKKILQLTFGIVLAFATNSFGQTNTFPTTGKVGIGTTTPNDTTLLHIKGGHTTSSTLLEYPLDAASQLQGSIFLKTWASEPLISWNGTGIGANMNKSLSSAYIRFIPQKTSGMMLFSTVDAAGVKYDNTMAIVNDKIGIGTTAPVAKLEVAGGTVKFSENWFPFSDGNNYHRALNHIFADNAGNEKMRITGTGNVGIGTTAPTEKLEINGNLLLSGTIKYGNGGVRTESRNNAGLQGNAGAMSGFYETYAPQNFPKDDSNWWHLIDTRHSNPTNNYAMQLAGSFFDQKLYFRKTNDSPTQPWREVITADPSGEMTIGKSDYTGGSLFFGNANHGIKRGYTVNGNDVGFYTTSGDLYLSTTNTTPQFVLKNSGNVGIGTTTPTAKLEVLGGVLGGVIDNKLEIARFSSTIANASLLKIFNTRLKAGGDWTSASTRIQQTIDVTDMGYLEFNPNNGLYGLALGTQTGESMRLANGGNIGIGTTTPTEKLEVAGNVVLSGANVKQTYNWTGISAFATGILGSTTNNSRFSISTNSAGEALSVNYLNGNVGIGTTDTKGYKLAVAGEMIAERVVVKLTGTWPDYVFKKNYGLRPLEQVEQFINQNSHLPEVPSAQEVTDKGIDVGAMNAKLLQKVEELTLYLIEQNKEIKALKNKVEILEKK